LRANVGRPIPSIPSTSRTAPSTATPTMPFPGERSGDDVAQQRGVRPAAAVDGYHVPGLGQVGHLEHVQDVSWLGPHRDRGAAEFRCPGDPAEPDPGPTTPTGPPQSAICVVECLANAAIASTTVHCCGCNVLMPRPPAAP
jgi:hypothetical protein